MDWKSYKDKERVRSYDKKERMVQPQAVIERIGELTKGDAVVVTDVGQHQCGQLSIIHIKWASTCNFRWFRNHGIWSASSHLEQRLQIPDKEVVLFVGDGGFQMTNQELAILNIYKVPIKVIMLNNHSLGMVRQWQESFYEGRTSESVFDTLPDFQLMAQSIRYKKTIRFNNARNSWKGI